MALPLRREVTAQEKVDEFLNALSEQAREIVRISDRAQKEAGKHSYQMYNEFRKKVSEFETFSIIIESKLKSIDERKQDELNDKFESISILIMNHLIKTSIKFFFVLSMSTSLPLGAREIFVEELRRIHETKRKLENPKFAAKIDEEAQHNLDLAEDILQEIIDKAPSLLNFGSGESTIV